LFVAPASRADDDAIDSEISTMTSAATSRIPAAKAASASIEGFNAPARSSRMRLDRGQHAWLHATRDTGLTVLCGVAWITFERGLDDVVRQPGESFVVPAATTVLIGPLRGAVELAARGVFEMPGHGEDHAATIEQSH
jgi:Protein of unknown function (DUF2917)